MKRLFLIFAVVCALIGVTMSMSLAGSSSSAGGSAKAVYNAIPSKVTGNVPSQGFECCQTNEFGDEVGLGGTARTLQSMSVVLSSFACQSGHWDGVGGACVTTPGATFTVPLTFTIYADNNGTAGDVLAQQTQTVNVLYRPSASTTCATPSQWYNSKDRMCYNGLAQTIKLSFTGATLTDQVIWSVAFNTTTAGYDPIGPAACSTSSGGCPYDSLNVGTFSFPNAPFVGTDIDEDQVFRCDTITTLCAMESGWHGYRPLGAIVATTK
jgi:hypothetical protein